MFIVLNENKEQCEAAELTRPKEKPCLPSVSSALVLGATLGLGEALVLIFLAGPILTVMGVDVVSRPVTSYTSCLYEYVFLLSFVHNILIALSGVSPVQ